MQARWRHLAAVVFAGAAAFAAPAAATDAEATDPFSACRERFARAPDDYDSSYCFYEVTFREQRWDDGSRLFETLIRAHPDNFWLPMAYGHVYRGREPERAEALYRQAAAGFQAARHAEGEILARSNLRNFLFPKAGRVADAGREVRRVAEIGASVSDPILKARAWILEATHIHETGEDLRSAYRLLKQATTVVFPDGPYRLRRTSLVSLGNVAFRLGRLDEALVVFRQLETLAADEGELLVQATARYNILSTAMLEQRLLPTMAGVNALLPLAERSLETATAAQNYDITLKSHLAIAELLATDSRARATALDHVRKCRILSVKLAQADDEALCWWMEASLLRNLDDAAARAAERHAIDADARASSPITHGFTAGRRMRLSWDMHPRERAIEDSLRAIDAIESLRDLQDGAESSAELLSTWTSQYYWLSGRLLQDAAGPDIALALTITERMRARTLLDRVGQPKAPDVDQRSRTRWRELREQISRVQRRLLDPGLGRETRTALLAQLERLELDEDEAERLLSLASGQRRGQSPPTFATVDALQSALAPDEALLSFQVGLWDMFDGTSGGGSWLIVVTRAGRSAYRLPDRVQLAQMVPIFSGLLARTDGVEQVAAIRLYRDLLRDGLAALPPGISRLILIPDGVLHRLPFEALRSGVNADPVGARFELVVAPSATLWLHWRQNGVGDVSGRALAFADPALPSTGAALTRGTALQHGVQLGRLPFARRESRAIARYVGSVDTLVGDAATERAFKNARLQEYGVLHLAVHAIADETRPRRSALVLAPGDEDEDGLLQAPEIETLELDGRVVVLSACQTAAGAILSGEGVMSLARAFFAGGATAVIGNRWPVRDEDAAFLFDAFYRAVGDGSSLSAALQQARVSAIAAGRPASVWASLVLLGDGTVRLRAEPSVMSGAARWRIPASVAIAALIVLMAAIARSRVQPAVKANVRP